MNTEMSLERRQVIRAMQSMGWTARRNPKGRWEFLKPDTDGYFISVRISQSHLSWNWLMYQMLKHDDKFSQLVRQTWESYRKARFAKTLAEVSE